MKNQSIVAAVLLVLVGVAARIIGAETHLYNFAPIVAIGLFSGSVIKDRKLAFLLAIGAQFIGDVLFAWFTPLQGFYGVAQLFTYAGLIAATYLGTFLKQRSMMKIVGYTMGASLIFFAISNLGYFIQGWNGYTLSGFIKTYVDALPFLKNGLLGDLVGTTFLFGTYAYYESRASKSVLGAA